MEDQRAEHVGLFDFGIDGGLTGAVSVIGKDGADVFDLEIIRLQSKGYIDTYVLNALFDAFPPRSITIELAGVRPEQGIVSSGQTMLVYGMLVGAALTRGCPVYIVSAVKWKRHFGLIGKSKDASLKLARRKFPHLEDKLRRKKDHNRAEGLLIGLYSKSVHSTSIGR